MGKFFIKLIIFQNIPGVYFSTKWNENQESSSPQLQFSLKVWMVNSISIWHVHRQMLSLTNHNTINEKTWASAAARITWEIIPITMRCPWTASAFKHKSNISPPTDSYMISTPLGNSFFRTWIRTFNEHIEENNQGIDLNGYSHLRIQNDHNIINLHNLVSRETRV